MKRWRRTEIRTERREITVVRTGHLVESLCKVCGCTRSMLHADEVAAAFSVEPSTVGQWMREGRIHGCIGAEGRLLICVESIRGSGLMPPEISS